MLFSYLVDFMKDNFILLENRFKKIKAMGLIKEMRKGPTGIGYTFESLLNKREDQESLPDFKGIELKCKLGYTKTPITLFNCAPKRNNESAIKYIFSTYSHHRYNNLNDYKLFERVIFKKYYIIRNEYHFNLKIDYYNQEILMLSFKNDNFIEVVCKWDFKDLKNKIYKKLQYLSLIEAYPYRRKDGIYYKYVKMTNYKLIGFFEFLQLIDNDKIFVKFYIKEELNNKKQLILYDHGVAFNIRKEYLKDLFQKI